MTRAATTMLLGLSLSGPLPGEIVCDSRPVPVPFGPHAYFLAYQTRCYHPAVGRLEKLKAACDLLTTAYGKEEGRLRCQDLIAQSGLDP